MNLDESQRRKVAEWIGQGCRISEVQNKLAAELGVQLTYMDVRFLIDDLKLKPIDPEPPKAPPTLGTPAQSPGTTPVAGAAPQPAELLPDEEPSSARVAVNVDHVAKPGALVSGKVKFSDGKSAEWYLDQYGRLGLVPEEQGYRPAQQDVMEFQAQLQNQLAKLGY